ncbi:hypothetical protein [Bacillus sp. AFS031507]|uniref:hypothetical protein n=1 Tax=Bacillus sp. AFS031507 TaxID=2033496 RepID=UPI000BFBBD57|nr:hypothetical protein [Bacillus sp. AFS031507]PGY06886.1 hypothetical protein COE25_26040 [Bacillus sp. AFS031507]
MSNKEELLKIISELEDDKIKKVLKIIEQMKNYEQEYHISFEDFKHNQWRIDYWEKALEGKEFSSVDPYGDTHFFKPKEEMDVRMFYDLALKDFQESKRRLNLLLDLKNFYDPAI